MEKDYTKVTTILSPFTGYGSVNEEVLRRAADRGTCIHNHIACYLNGIGMWNIDPCHQPYVDSFLQFWDDIGDKEIVCFETRFNNDELLLTGACDLVINQNGKNILIDWKTSSQPNKTWQPQGSAYSWLAKKNGIKIDEIWFVKLAKDGKPPKVFEYEEDFHHFMKCYEIYDRYFRDKKIGHPPFDE